MYMSTNTIKSSLSPFFQPSEFTQILLYCSFSMFDENFPEMHHGYILPPFHDHKTKK